MTHENSPISIGWGGHLPGEPHCPGEGCPGIMPGNCPVVHAEVNALRKAEKILGTGIHVDLYTTHSPCVRCMTDLVASPLILDRLFFEVPYRNTEHLIGFGDKTNRVTIKEYIRTRSTEVYEVTPAGYIVEYFSRKVVELP